MKAYKSALAEALLAAGLLPRSGEVFTYEGVTYCVKLMNPSRKGLDKREDPCYTRSVPAERSEV